MTAGELIPTLGLITLGTILAVGVWRYIVINRKIDD